MFSEKDFNEEIETSEEPVDINKKLSEILEKFDTENKKLIDSITELETKLKEKDIELEKIKSYSVNLLSDIENISKRHDKVIEDTKDYSISSFGNDILSTVDSIEMAILDIPYEFQDGLKITLNELLSTLKSRKITVINSDNCEFDPEFHMAVKTVTDENIDDNFVCETLRKGYKIGDRCLRPSMVVVNSKP